MTYQEQETPGAELMTNLVHIDELELTDEQLEMVAGGTDVIFGITIGVFIGAAALTAVYYAHAE